uniref:Uncharacterized protein n=1 Tax=Picea sitchensis TaxID=3332 RepID=A9P115_PICSI|nr:unknown [Picea sitchensis]
MEQRQHTKLLLTKKKVIIKERNLNPRASLKFESSRLKQMRATTTKLIYRIWKEYYSSSDLGSNDCEENDVKEIKSRKIKNRVRMKRRLFWFPRMHQKLLLQLK